MTHSVQRPEPALRHPSESGNLMPNRASRLRVCYVTGLCHDTAGTPISGFGVPFHFQWREEDSGVRRPSREPKVVTASKRLHGLPQTTSIRDSPAAV